tara:strand:+ start:1204 stop:1374 length:171 start_codon:yes stop_codon:yes gene_type:complete
MDNILRQVIEAEAESKKQVHIKEEDVNGLNVIEIKYKDDFYIDNKLRETIIIMSKG